MRRLLATAALAAGTAMAGAGCGTSQMAFTQDHRLHFTAPHSRALVAVPVTVRWAVDGFDVAPAGSARPSTGHGYFAVFVDRAPVRPGQSLSVLADPACKKTPGCFNAQYLAGKGVYTTTATTLTLTSVPSLASYEKTPLHEVTVVLMDTAGRRIGESAWYLDFRMGKRAA